MTSAALPGQRAAQRPLRAAKAAQGAMGRAVTAGGARVGQMFAVLDGEHMEFRINEDGVREEVVHEPLPTSEEEGL
jgi:hypothetical protein